jgi:cytoplasmic iron level regulating protein YaaA (DUF328/UPF0246 family)
MLVLLSPSKAQDFDAAPPTRHFSTPVLLEQSQLLVKELRKLEPRDIRKLMGISEKLATLNHERYKKFRTPFTLSNARQAAFAFKGDAYIGLKAESFDEPTLEFAQAHIRILSGLYGLLKPLDLIQPYRLEMHIKLKNPRGADLYNFWGNSITEELGRELAGHESRVVINLASEEYFKAIHPKELDARLITPQFREKKTGGYRTIGFVAKKARGSMARYIAENRITHPEALQFFAEDGYRLNVGLSRPDNPVYTRG